MLRQDTFRKVSLQLDEAVVHLEQAVKVLQESEYWANTSECVDIMNMVRKCKQLSKDFYS